MKGMLFLLLVLGGVGWAVSLLHTSSTEDGESGAHTSAPTEVPSTTVLTVTNRSTEAICGIYAAPAEGGVDLPLLPPSRVVLPGEWVTATIPSGTYNLRANNCFDTPLAAAEGVRIDGPMEWTIVYEQEHQ